MARKKKDPPKPFEFESSATRITEAADTLGVSAMLSELPEAEAAALRQRIEATFLVIPSYDWWWARMKHGRSFYSQAPGWQAIDTVAAFNWSGPVWLMPVYDDKGEVFRMPWPITLDILRHSKLSEYAVVADDLSWIVIVNHHDAVFGAGDRMEKHLLALEQRPGGQGGPVDPV